jgi:hypothetical protein
MSKEEFDEHWGLGEENGELGIVHARCHWYISKSLSSYHKNACSDKFISEGKK